jgi:hypothetical protein
VFVRKIERLGQAYTHLRRTRGDGNCFFRAFIYSYLEHLLLTNNAAECGRCVRPDICITAEVALRAPSYLEVKLECFNAQRADGTCAGSLSGCRLNAPT